MSNDPGDENPDDLQEAYSQGAAPEGMGLVPYINAENRSIKEHIIGQLAQKDAMRIAARTDWPGGLEAAIDQTLYYGTKDKRKLSEYERPSVVRKQIINWFIDSYTFYRRHSHHDNEHECDKSEASWLALRDTFEYMLRLKNDLPVPANRPMSVTPYRINYK